MPDVLQTVQSLIGQGKLRISLHGYRELAADDILVGDVIDGASLATAVEAYPDAVRGRAFWCCSEIVMGSRCISSGVCQKV